MTAGREVGANEDSFFGACAFGHGIDESLRRNQVQRLIIHVHEITVTNFKEDVVFVFQRQPAVASEEAYAVDRQFIGGIEVGQAYQRVNVSLGIKRSVCDTTAPHDSLVFQL